MKGAAALPIFVPLLLAVFVCGTYGQGQCQTQEQANVCEICHMSRWQNILPTPCCSSRTAYLICEACLRSDAVCKDLEDAVKSSRGEGGMKKRENTDFIPQEDWELQFPPDRRAQFFLGRRDLSSAPSTEMLKQKKAHVFLGKRFPSWYLNDLHGNTEQLSYPEEQMLSQKRGRAFLGKRSLKKRSTEESYGAFPDKSDKKKYRRGRLFESYGKREN